MTPFQLKYWTKFYLSPYEYGRVCRVALGYGARLNWAQQLYAAYHRSAIERRINQGRKS